MSDPNTTTAKRRSAHSTTTTNNFSPVTHCDFTTAANPTSDSSTTRRPPSHKPANSTSTPTPPPPELDYRQESRSTSNTPVSTPLASQELWPPSPSHSLTQPRKEKEKDLYFSWHKRPGAPNRNSNPVFGSDWNFAPDSEEALFEDGENSLTPLFPDDDPPPASAAGTMSSAFPLDISLPPRLNSQSPRNHTSNLTFALQEAGASAQPAQDGINDDLRQTTVDPGRLGVGARNDSITNMFGGSSYYGGSGARPISVKDRQRRESNTGGSFMGGMSWGGMSVGSFIRDE
jgi:transcription factor SFP1